MIRLLIIALLGFLLYTLITMVRRSLSGSQGSGESGRNARSRRGEDMVQDPHCGTFVPASDAVTATVKGQRHYFCSARCRDAYRAEN